MLSPRVLSLESRVYLAEITEPAKLSKLATPAKMERGSIKDVLDEATEVFYPVLETLGIKASPISSERA
jgi:hypothetical protein